MRVKGKHREEIKISFYSLWEPGTFILSFLCYILNNTVYVVSR